MMTKLKVLALAVGLCGWSMSSWAAQLVHRQHHVEEYQLDNGLRVILAPNERENKIYTNMIYFTGALDDPEGKGGLAHLLEHLLFKGTENLPDDEFQRKLDQYTLSSNAMTSFYATQYINILQDNAVHLNEVLRLEAERMDKSIIKMHHVPNEIEIVKREREIRLDQPFAVVQDQIFKALYGNQSLGRAPIGDLDELQTINLDELQHFYKTWYKPNNAALIISGRFDKQQTLNDVEKQFASIPAAAYFPERAKDRIPKFNLSTLENRQFKVQKGSDFMTLLGYLNQIDSKQGNALTLIELMFTMQPSGRLYQSIDQPKKAIESFGVSLVQPHQSLTYFGAVYAPQHQRDELQHTLIQQVEQGEKVNETDLKRAVQVVKNSVKQIEKEAVAFGGILASYLIEREQGWSAYFQDLQQLDEFNVNDINQTIQQYLTAEQRIVVDIEPTPETQKSAQVLPTLQPEKNVESVEETDALKDISAYETEIQQYTTDSRQAIERVSAKIIDGQFKQGLQYRFYPTVLNDDKVYATLTVGMGTEQTFKNKSEVLSQLATQLLRGSTHYTLQQIVDKSLALDGTVQTIPFRNGIRIQLAVDKQHFEEYLAFILELLKTPMFDVEDYEVNRSQAIASLDRPYTEPEVVAKLTLDRLIEQYQPDDFLYHFEPEHAKQQLNATTIEQVKQLYHDFFAMNHAQITITGEFKPERVQRLLKKSLANWTTKQPYQRIVSQYNAHSAQQVHALAEQREFGYYQAFLPFALQIDHADAVPMHVLGHILGGSQLSSRLGRALREKNNLVYGFQHQMNIGLFTANSAWRIGANYPVGQAQQVSQALKQTLQAIREHGVTEQELAQAKVHLLKQRVATMRNDQQLHRVMTNQLDQNRMMTDRLQRDAAIAQVSLDDVKRVAMTYLTPEQLVEVFADSYAPQSEMTQ